MNTLIFLLCFGPKWSSDDGKCWWNQGISRPSACEWDIHQIFNFDQNIQYIEARAARWNASTESHNTQANGNETVQWSRKTHKRTIPDKIGVTILSLFNNQLGVVKNESTENCQSSIQLYLSIKAKHFFTVLHFWWVWAIFPDFVDLKETLDMFTVSIHRRSNS